MSAFVFDQVTPLLHEILKRQSVSYISKQALDWLSITTCCTSCYLALTNDTKEATLLQYVAATPSQHFMIGKTHERVEELTQKIGVSFALIDESIKTGQPEVAHISDVFDPSTNKVNSNAVRRYGSDTSAKGSLLLCPVIRPSQPGDGRVFGVLYADTIGQEKEFNKADEDIMRTTAALLAELLDPRQSQAPNEASVRLFIENEVLGDDDTASSPIRFLKHVWLKVNTDISKITNNQLLELAKYSHPPPIIPITITATLLVALGSNPKKVELWEESRKRIKTSLVEKIVAFDPTDPTRRKKAFYNRARKITKGYSAHDVFTRGSYPASCFFTWTFVTILLHKSADSLRKALRNSSVGAVPLELLQTEEREPDDDEPEDVEGAEINVEAADDEEE
jgi:hypothetical protein